MAHRLDAYFSSQDLVIRTSWLAEHTVRAVDFDAQDHHSSVLPSQGENGQVSGRVVPLPPDAYLSNDTKRARSDDFSNLVHVVHRSY